MQIIGHRGAAHLAPENTRTAYTLALELGADGVECDVHLTADGHVVCFHDFTLERTSNGTGRVSDHTLAELRTLDITSWKPPAPRPTPMPRPVAPDDGELMTLPELLQLCQHAAQRLDRDLTLVIELKHPPRPPLDTAGPQWAARRALDDAVLRILAQAGWDANRGHCGRLRISLMSFAPDSCAHLASITGPTPVMVLMDAAAGGPPAEVDAETTATAWELARTGTVHGAGPGLDVVLQAPDAVASLIRRGSLVRVWTVDDVQGAAACERIGVQEITTNRPELFQSRT